MCRLIAFAPNACIYATKNMQVTEYHTGMYTLVIGGRQYMYRPPMRLYRADRFLPIKPFVPAGKSVVKWKLPDGRQISYNQIRKAVKAYRTDFLTTK